MNACSPGWIGLLSLLGVAVGAVSLAAAETDAKTKPASYIVHEWGTFTTLQDDEGRDLPGINIDDEPVPGFVHNLAPFVLQNPILSNEHWVYRQKGVPRQHPRVTMRLETPVLYFYPSSDGKLPEQVDVEVMFRGGWLTEFYPYAQADLPGLKDNFDFGPITPETRGRLSWKAVRLNTKAAGPETEEKVWLAPRKVKAVDVSVDYDSREGRKTESERYLFYRGVANQQSPIKISTDRATHALTIRSNFDDALLERELVIGSAWLVDIREKGETAFRTFNALRFGRDREQTVAKVSGKFSKEDYAGANFQKLHDAMHRALVADGLYEDEAAAMLSTWQRAYFQTPGLRFFYLVPRRWTDRYLPIQISGNPSIERVMMGRIELISDAQREKLKKLAATASSDPKWVREISEGPEKQAFLSGRSNFGELGVKIPADYQTYLDLGRFRNALVIAEAGRAPTPNLQRFIANYGLQPYRWAER